jgi:hypothetical protein
MRLRPWLPFAAFQCGLLLAVALPVPFLGAQTNSAPAAKPKVKMVPRPLPGMGSSSSSASQSGPSAADLQSAEADSRAKVPLFRPASVRPSGGSYAQQPNATQVATQPQDVDRARIVLIRRKGTFPLPQTSATEAPVLVNDSTVRPAPTEGMIVPAALPPGKIRIIPKDSVKLGTPAPTP